jgi:hypothetical protein
MHTFLMLVTVPTLLASSTPFATISSQLQGVSRTPQREVVRSLPDVSSRRSRRLQRREVLEKQRARTVRPGIVHSPTPLPEAEKRFPNQFYVPTNPLPTLDATSHIFVLGEKAPVMATIKVTPQDEPVAVRTVTVTLAAEVSSITAIEVLDDVGFVLGKATIDLAASGARDVFTLSLSPDNAYFIDRKDTVIFAVRPLLKEGDEGGASGQTAQVESLTVSAIGDWTNRTNAVSTSGPDFQVHETANATIVSITNAGAAKGTFSTGNQKTLGSFTVSARKNRDAEPAITALSFSVSTPTEVSLSTLKLRGNDSATTSDCTLSSFTISCASIPAEIGSLDAPRTFTLLGNVSVSSHPDPYLQISLNTPGRPGSTGDITWTDGDESFTWVPFNPPIVEGTVWE